MIAVKCGRCDGKGAIASFSVKFSGKCFACGGSGTRWMTKAAFDKKQALRRASEEYEATQRAKHPICKACGYAKGGAEGYTETSCKCAALPRAALASTPKETQK